LTSDHRTINGSEDKEFSLFYYMIPRIVWLLSILSIYTHLRWFFVRVLNKKQVPYLASEIYLILWGLLIFYQLYDSPQVENCVALFSLECMTWAVAFAIYRLFDIMVFLGETYFIIYYKNIDCQGNFIESGLIGRWVFLLFINLFEIIACFAIIMANWGNSFSRCIVDPLTAFYQSILTITTLGYGEIHAVGDAAKIIVIAQLFYFLIFGLLLLPQVFSSMRVKQNLNIKMKTKIPDLFALGNKTKKVK
jgi:hypothetical protein